MGFSQSSRHFPAASSGLANQPLAAFSCWRPCSPSFHPRLDFFLVPVHLTLQLIPHSPFSLPPPSLFFHCQQDGEGVFFLRILFSFCDWLGVRPIPFLRPFLFVHFGLAYFIPPPVCRHVNSTSRPPEASARDRFYIIAATSLRPPLRQTKAFTVTVEPRFSLVALFSHFPNGE